MPKYRLVFALCTVACLFVGTFAVISIAKNQSKASESEQALWNLEHEYWRHVQDNDLPAYLTLWHQDFLGWPLVSAAPVRKDHITDWIASQTSKGLHFNAGELRPAAIHVTGDIAVAYYWMTYSWQDKDGKGDSRTTRVTHTWLKEGNVWRIIGGMSMQETAPRQP
jgi:ketosteroid isomerase-like protein